MSSVEDLSLYSKNSRNLWKALISQVRWSLWDFEQHYNSEWNCRFWEEQMAMGRPTGRLLLRYRKQWYLDWDVALVEIWKATTAQVLLCSSHCCFSGAHSDQAPEAIFILYKSKGILSLFLWWQSEVSTPKEHWPTLPKCACQVRLTTLWMYPLSRYVGIQRWTQLGH